MKKDFLMKCVAALAMLLVPLPLMFVFEVTAFKGFTLWHYPIYLSLIHIYQLYSGEYNISDSFSPEKIAQVEQYMSCLLYTSRCV